MAECGVRGGYLEVVNLLPEIHALLMKLTTAVSSPTVLGQALLECVVNPLKPGDPSYDKFHAEKTNVLKELADRAKMVADAFNSITGISCSPVQGALYAFPKASSFI